MYSSSKAIFERAQNSIPGGVNSPVRAFKSVGGTPVFIKRAAGAYLFDEDDHAYLDLINSWGPMIMGHVYQPVVEALEAKIRDSTSFGTPTVLEVEMAELICLMVPGAEKVRMVNSGTEACMSALRLARGFTGRNKFIKFEGCYHGHADPFLVKAGSGVATLGLQQVPGVTQAVEEDTLVCDYNDLESVRTAFAEYPEQIAAVFVEPVAGNMGCVPPQDGFLQGLREICTEDGALLVFDEVMTGFRLAPGGAQEYYRVDADLMTFGKIIGGGLPVGAVAGKRKIMDYLAPEGPVYQAGTLSGNPLAMTAGFTLLKILHSSPQIYNSLEDKGSYLQNGLAQIFSETGIPARINRVGSMVSIFFTDQAVIDWHTAASNDTAFYAKFFHGMLAKGIYLPPSAFETYFISEAMEVNHLDYVLDTVRAILLSLTGIMH